MEAELSMIHSILNMVLQTMFRHRIRGAHRLYNRFMGSRRLAITTKHGLRMQLHPYEYIDSIIIRSGYYEEEV